MYKFLASGNLPQSPAPFLPKLSSYYAFTFVEETHVELQTAVGQTHYMLYMQLVHVRERLARPLNLILLITQS